jgi:Right handed beta helix region
MKRVFRAAWLCFIVSAAAGAIPVAAAMSLPAPTILSPVAGETIDDTAPLLWNQVPGAIRYEVEVCGDAACADIVGRSTVPSLYSLVRRPLGMLHWRVAAVDASGQRGTWSPNTRFAVAHGIGGTIYEDVNGDNAAAGFVPRPGVRVRLYRDDGRDMPVDDDKLVDTVTTDRTGAYAFHPNASGTYWVAVDGESVTPYAGIHSGAAGSVHAEQTWGGAGALCLQLNGAVGRHKSDGACFGGRSMQNDDPSHLAGSRHVARVLFADTTVTGIDFGFSFNVVTSTADTTTPGTLRQFVANANAIRGPNTMHFVPVTKSPNGKWWSIRLTSPLPALTDAGTTIDGTVYSSVGPGWAYDTEVAPLVRVNDHVVTGRKLTAPDGPRLEVAMTGERGIDAVAPAAVRAIALAGARTNIVARAAVVVDHAAIGVHPDGTPVTPAGEEGIVVESGATRLESVFVSSQTNIGIAVRPGATLTATALFVTRCGVENAGAAISLASSDASITDSFVYENDAPAVIVGGNDASAGARRNVIRASAISHNRAGILLASDASGTIIEENDIVWNSEGGVITNPGGTPARTARVSHNHFNENGGVPIDLQHQTEKRHLAPAICHSDGLSNEGLGAPQVTRAEVRNVSKGVRELLVQGKACPGTTIEVYESFVTGELKDPIERERLPRDLPSVREAVKSKSFETRDNEAGPSVDIIASVGEFNYAVTVTAGADGAFTATIPVVEQDINPTIKYRENLGENDVEMDVHDIFHGARTYAIAAVAIDAAGNTSEFSRRHIVGDRGGR